MRGGPEIIEGKIIGIQGEHFSISGEEGQNITLRVTKDTNKAVQKLKAPNSRQGKKALKSTRNRPNGLYGETSGG